MVENLFVPEGVDGVEFGGFAGGVEAEEDADGDGGGEGDDDRAAGDGGGPFEEAGHEFGDDHTEGDAKQAAKNAEGDRFGEKLQQDIVAARADREADADLAGAFGDADEHDVHNADAADEE